MKRVIETMAKIQAVLGGALLFVCLGLVIVQMMSGYLGTDASWAKKASLCAMIWGIFVESGALVHEKRHFAFSGLKERLRDWRAAALLEIGSSLIKIACCLLFIYYGALLSISLGNGAKAEFLSFGELWLCLPVCGATSLIYLAYQLFCDVRQLVEGGERR